MKIFFACAFFAFLLIFALARSLDFLDSKRNLIVGFFSRKTLSNELSYSILRNSLATVLLTAILGLVFLFFDENPSASTFGDFFAGTLSPIFSFLSFVILIWSLHAQMQFQQDSENLQHDQLNQARQQKHDEFFYLLLDRWRNSADSVIFHENSGREILKPTASAALAKYMDDLENYMGNSEYYQNEENLHRKNGNTNKLIVDYYFSGVHSYADKKIEFLFSYFSIFCRLLDYISQNMHENRASYLKIVKSYMRPKEIYLAYVLAACNAYNELHAIEILNSSGFLNDVRHGEPHLVYIAHHLTAENEESGYFVGRQF